MRAAQTEVGMVKIRDQRSNLGDIPKHLPQDLMPNWILREVGEDEQMVLDFLVLNCPQPLGWSVIFACVSLLLKRRHFLVIMVVLPRGQSDI